MHRTGLLGFIDRFRGAAPGLDAYELAIVDAVASRLPLGDGQRLRKRARDVNMVQRLFGGMETNLYLKKGGKLLHPPETAITGLPRTARFAKFAVKSSDQLSRLKGTIHLVNGQLFSLEFDRPTKFADARKIDEIQVTILGPPFADPDAEAEAAGDWPPGEAPE